MQRLSYVGELGYEIYVQTYVNTIYNLIIEIGKNLNFLTVELMQWIF